MAIDVVEQCRVAPSSGAVPELLLPLLYSDILFLSVPLSEHVMFHSNSQCSESHFMDTIVPSLKNSLSLTLKHFIPLAGNIVFPLTTGMPVSHYVKGDSVSLAIAVSDADFTHLTGNHPRDADQFHELLPDMPTPTYLPGFVKYPIVAIQVTLFPNQGIGIGVVNHHGMTDGFSLFRFVSAWASITKFNGDAQFLASAPFYDRSRVQDADSLTTEYWKHMKMHRPLASSTNIVSTHKWRATFVLSEAEIKKLKNSVLHKKPSTTAHLSTFAIVCAHVWTSLARSEGEEARDDDQEYFHFVADCRRRLNPPLPDNYIGNCLALLLAELTHGKLKGDQGIVLAAEAIVEVTRKTVNNERSVLDGYIERLLELGRIKQRGNRMLVISLSPRLDPYGADFGWAEPRKFEVVHNDLSGSVVLCKSRESEGGVEIGVSLSRVKMDAFAANFNQGLREAAEITYDTHLSKL